VASESPRIAELRRRVHGDPASIAFAQLAEEYRRAGNYDDAVKYCRTGLARHPGYLSARVTLGRALIEIGGLDDAHREFTLVLKSAPDNLAAIRGMAEIHQRRGELSAALEYYKRALTLARFDPDLEETVSRIGREMGTVSGVAAVEMSFEQARTELLAAPARIVSARPAPASSASTDAPPPAPAAAPPPAPIAAQAPAGAPEPLIDFDAILASLGVPDAAPPPVMEFLLSDPPVSAPRPDPILPDVPALSAAADAFADLER
jgi:tetratricopeptide (TPR) repeat protein